MWFVLDDGACKGLLGECDVETVARREESSLVDSCCRWYCCSFYVVRLNDGMLGYLSFLLIPFSSRPLVSQGGGFSFSLAARSIPPGIVCR